MESFWITLFLWRWECHKNFKMCLKSSLLSVICHRPCFSSMFLANEHCNVFSMMCLLSENQFCLQRHLYVYHMYITSAFKYYYQVIKECLNVSQCARCKTVGFVLKAIKWKCISLLYSNTHVHSNIYSTSVFLRGTRFQNRFAHGSDKQLCNLAMLVVVALNINLFCNPKISCTYKLSLVKI